MLLSTSAPEPVGGAAGHALAGLGQEIGRGGVGGVQAQAFLGAVVGREGILGQGARPLLQDLPGPFRQREVLGAARGGRQGHGLGRGDRGPEGGVPLEGAEQQEAQAERHEGAEHDGLVPGRSSPWAGRAPEEPGQSQPDRWAGLVVRARGGPTGVAGGAGAGAGAGGAWRTITCPGSACALRSERACW